MQQEMEDDNNIANTSFLHDDKFVERVFQFFEGVKEELKEEVKGEEKKDDEEDIQMLEAMHIEQQVEKNIDEATLKFLASF